MDDFIIATEDFDEHLEVISQVVNRLNNAGFTISMEKSKFCRDRINFLGYVITENGVECDKEKIQTIIDYPIPRTLKKKRQFIGMVGWHDRTVFHSAIAYHRSVERWSDCTEMDSRSRCCVCKN